MLNFVRILSYFWLPIEHYVNVVNVLEALSNDPYRDVPPIYTAGEYVYIILKREKSMFSLVYEFENEVGSWFILYSDKMFDISPKFFNLRFHYEYRGDRINNPPLNGIN